MDFDDLSSMIALDKKEQTPTHPLNSQLNGRNVLENGTCMPV